MIGLIAQIRENLGVFPDWRPKPREYITHDNSIGWHWTYPHSREYYRRLDAAAAAGMSMS